MVITMLKTFLATSLLLTTGLTTQASWVNDNGVTIYDSYDLPPSHQPLFNALKESGVPVVNGSDWEQCVPSEDTYLAGFYIPRFDVIVLCPNSPAPDLLGTLVHEAVHAVQDCRAGQDNSVLIHHATQDMINELPQSELDTINNLYPPEERLDEVEARYLDQYPDYVAIQLNTYCL